MRIQSSAISARTSRRLRRSCGGADLGPVFAHLTPLDDFDRRSPWGDRKRRTSGEEGEKPGPPPDMDEVIEIARRGGGRAENDHEDGDAKDGADLATHLDDGAAGGGLIRPKPGSTGGDESRNNQTGAEAEADEYSSTTHQQRTNGGENAGRYRRRVSSQANRSRRHHDWAWSDTEASLDGRPPPALLEPEDEAKELGAKGDRDKEHSHVGPREHRVAEQVKVDNRRCVPQ